MRSNFYRKVFLCLLIGLLSLPFFAKGRMIKASGEWKMRYGGNDTWADIPYDDLDSSWTPVKMPSYVPVQRTRDSG